MTGKAIDHAENDKKHWWSRKKLDEKDQLDQEVSDLSSSPFHSPTVRKENSALSSTNVHASARPSIFSRLLGKKDSSKDNFEHIHLAPAAEAPIKKNDAKKISKGHKEKKEDSSLKAEDIERNRRHGAVMDIISGRKQLPPTFTSKYTLGDVLGDGAFGFVMTGKHKQYGKEVRRVFFVFCPGIFSFGSN